jgi:hypothetical protein
MFWRKLLVVKTQLVILQMSMTKRKRNHVAVLVGHDRYVMPVKCFLASKGIPCGSVEEQVSGSDGIGSARPDSGSGSARRQAVGFRFGFGSKLLPSDWVRVDHSDPTIRLNTNDETINCQNIMTSTWTNAHTKSVCQVPVKAVMISLIYCGLIDISVCSWAWALFRKAAMLFMCMPHSLARWRESVGFSRVGSNPSGWSGHCRVGLSDAVKCSDINFQTTIAHWQ